MNNPALAIKIKKITNGNQKIYLTKGESDYLLCWLFQFEINKLHLKNAKK